MMTMKPHEKVMAESGVESHWFWTAASVAVGLWGANKQAKAAGKQADKQNEAVEKQHQYNLIVPN